MKNTIFLLGALLVFAVGSAQTQTRTTTTDAGTKTVKVENSVDADGKVVKATTTTTTTTTTAPKAEVRTMVQNTGDIIAPEGSKVNATDGQTLPRAALANDPATTGTKSTRTTTTTTKETTRP